MPWGAAVAAGVGLVGSSMQSSAAKNAAAGQERASAEANALQRYMYDNNVALNQPVVNTGNAARDRLSYLLGLSPTGFSGSSGGGSSQPLTYDQLRSQLVGQYTRTGSTSGQSVPNPTGDPATAYNLLMQGLQDPQQASIIAGQRSVANMPGFGPGYWMPGTDNNAGNSRDTWVSTGDAMTSQIDESGLDAEIKRRLAEQDAQRQAQIDAAKNDPNYGRLAQQFEFNTYTPDKFSYTGEDLYKDPSYLFRLQQGQKALDRQGAASGRFLSGAQLQASSNYNQGAASQEFQNAYQRALGTFGTNEGNRYNAFNTNENNRFNAYQANFANSVNPLLSLAGSGQVTSQFLGNAGQQNAAAQGNNLTNNANAQGAAGIAGANSIANGLNTTYNNYQQNQLMNSLLNRGSVNNNPSGGRTDTLFGSGGFFSGTGGSGD